MLCLRFQAIYRISVFTFGQFFSLFFCFFNCLKGPFNFAFKATGAPLWPPLVPHRVRYLILYSNHVTQLFATLQTLEKQFFRSLPPNGQKTSFSAIFLPFFAFLLDKTVHMAPKNSNMCVTVPGHYIRTFGGERLGPNLFLIKKTPKNDVFQLFFAFFCQISS